MQRDWNRSSDESAATALVSGSFYEQGAKIFQKALQTNIDNVMKNEITVETALANVNDSYQEWIYTLKTRINQAFFEQLRPKCNVMVQEAKITAEQKNLEIRELQQQLNSLLSSSSTAMESLRFFDQGIRRLEQKVRERRDKVERMEIPPSLVTDLQVERTLHRFGDELVKIKEEIQRGNRTLESAFERTQERYGDSIKLLIDNLQDRYNDTITRISKRYAKRYDRMNEAYEQQRNFLEKINLLRK